MYLKVTKAYWLKEALILQNRAVTCKHMDSVLPIAKRTSIFFHVSLL